MYKRKFKDTKGKITKDKITKDKVTKDKNYKRFYINTSKKSKDKFTKVLENTKGKNTKV